MTAAGRQDATGGASALQLFNAITDPNAASCQVSGTTSGWVFSQNFTIAIDAGTASEEKILCSAITGTGPATLTFLTRGYDGTVPTTHGQGATVTHIWPSTMVMDIERHIYDTGEDDHTQYLTSVRHASPALHEFGSPAQTFAFGAGVTAPADVAATADPGNGANPARDDHVHAIGDDAINAFAMFDDVISGVDADIAPVTNGATGSGGTVTAFARADHVHPFTPVPPLGPLTAAGTGVSTLTYAQINALTSTDLWAGRTVWQTDIGAGRRYIGLVTYNGSRWVSHTQADFWVSLTSASTNLDTNSSWNTFSWTAQEDLDALAAGSIITIPTGWAGLWTFEAGVSWDANEDGVRSVRINGSVFGSRRIGTIHGCNGALITGALTVRVADGETISVSRFQNSGGNLALLPVDGTHFFTARRVHA